MPPRELLPLWAGRTLALLGIVLVAFNLRTAVAAISPITADIAVDIPLDSVTIGLLGALPPIAFAISGLTAPYVAHRIGLELALVLASAAMLVGHLARAVSGSYVFLLIGSIVVLMGMGFGNILIPPAVKRYFPDRIGLITAAYGTLMSLSTALPAVLAAPIAHSAGWRVSLGVWAFFSLSAVLPWAILTARQRSAERAAKAAVNRDEAPELPAPPPRLMGSLRGSRVAWGITIAFTVSTITAYSFFAWLPEILVDIAGVSVIEAGALLGLFGIVGLPFAIIIPPLAARLRNVGLLIYPGVASFLLGFGGLLLAPTFAPWLWVALIGAGQLLFPLSLVLINLRTRSPQSSIALSGFSQSVGYTVGALGPLLVGMLHSATGSWTGPLIMLLLVAASAIVSGLMLSKKTFVEDELPNR